VAQKKTGAPNEIHLFNVAGSNWEADGRFEQPEHDLAPTADGALLQSLAAMLPPPNHRPSFGWSGCDLTGWPGGPPPPPPPPPLHPKPSITGSWLMKNHQTAKISEYVSGGLVIDRWPKYSGVLDHATLTGWFSFGGENLTMTVAPSFNSISFSNHATWTREEAWR
jgi:hypothetical protein